jgi:hypothetical protein
LHADINASSNESKDEKSAKDDHQPGHKGPTVIESPKVSVSELSPI